MKDVKAQLKAVKHADGLVNPNRVWVSKNRARLMSQIENTAVKVTKKIPQHEHMQYAWYSTQKFIKAFIPHNMSRVARPVFTMVLALMLTTSGWVASAYAQPGDTLWSAKEAFGSVIERSQLAFANNEDDIALNIKFASKRAQVIKTVVERDDIKTEKKTKIVKKNAEEIEQKLINAKEGIKNVDAENTAEMIKDVSLKTKEIAKSLKETTEESTKNLDNQELTTELAKQTTETQKVSLEMVETVVQKKVDAQLEITEEEKTVIKEHIDEVVEDMKEDTKKAKEQTDEMVDVVDNVKIIDGEDGENGGVDISEQADGSENMSTTTGDVVVLEKDAGTQVHDVADQVDDAIKKIVSEGLEVDDLVEDNILEAIKKTRALTQTVEEAVDEVTRVTEDVLPAIQNSAEQHGEVKTDEDDKDSGEDTEIESMEEHIIDTVDDTMLTSTVKIIE